MAYRDFNLKQLQTKFQLNTVLITLNKFWGF